MTFMRFLNVNTQLTPAATSGVPSKNCLIIGQRKTNGAYVAPKAGYTNFNYYQPILLPSFPDGKTALNYLKNYNINSQIGISFTLTLPAPSTITVAGAMTSLVWNTIPFDFLQLTQFALSGTLVQDAVSGVVFSAEIITVMGVNKAQMIVRGTPEFVTAGDSGEDMTLTGLNNVPYPDPNNSDPIALMVWDFYQTALSANISANGAPAAYISILSDRDTTINASATPINLGHPTAVVENSDDSVTLTYPTSRTGLGYLPSGAFGNTTVVQAGTPGASGTFAGYIQNGSNIYITVTDVTGTYVTGENVTVTLDNTLDVFDYLDNIELYAACLQFPINTLNDITTTQAAFFNGIAEINQANQVLNGHYLTYGMAGNITNPAYLAGNLPSPNTQNDVLVSYPYVYKFGGIPYDNTAKTVGSGRVAAATMYLLANNDAPYYALMMATINHLPVSSVASTTSYSAKPNGTGDLAVTQGWLPLAPNTNNVVQLLQANTTLITEPGTDIPDNEFRYIHIWDCVRWTKREVTVLFKRIVTLPNNQGTALMSPAFIKQFKAGIYGILKRGEDLGMFENVALYQNLVEVRQDPINPTQVDAYIPEQIIPQVNGGNVLINVFSSLYQFNNNTGAAA